MLHIAVDEIQLDRVDSHRVIQGVQETIDDLSIGFPALGIVSLDDWNLNGMALQEIQER
jgi:hypothetical protein